MMKGFISIQLLIGLLACLALGGCGSAKQGGAGSTGLSWKNKLKIADKFYEEGYFYDASHYYEEVLDDQPENVDVTYKLAESYFFSRDYKMANQHYKTVMEKNKDLYPFSHYKYALTLKMNGKYREAKKAFEDFIKTYRAFDAPVYKKKVKNEIAGCDYALTAMENPLNVMVVHMGTEVNAAYTEASPMPVGDDKLLYASLRSDTIIRSEDLKGKVARFKIYESTKQGRKWSKGEPITNNVNVPKMDVANGVFSPDGSKFFFTQCEANDAGALICAIYESDYKDGDWTKGKKLNEQINLPGFTSTQPAVQEDKRRKTLILYFVSDRPDGQGGRDIWYTEITAKGEYKKPRSVGKKINTVSDEITPFFNASSNVLSFSSDGHPSMGGYDVFYTSGRGRKWTKPENAGFPINSRVDDMYLVADANEEGGYFVSNRVGTIALKSETCCDDIFRYSWDRDLIPKISVDGFGFDQDEAMSSFQERSTIKLHVLRAWGDTAKTTALNDDNFFVYEELPSLEQYLFVLDQMDTENPGENNMARLSLLDSKGNLIAETEINDKGYFVFKELPRMKNYLFAPDVVSEVTFRLLVVEQDSSEILINEMTTLEGNPFSFDLKPDKNYKIESAKNGYIAGYVYLTTVGIKKSVVLHRNLPLQKLELNKSIVLKDIYYDFDKATLRPESDRTLGKLVDILNVNPSIIVELGAHTDSKGEDAYNQKLSQRRAESVVKYLKKHGIPKGRLVAKGYGETTPIAGNTNSDGTDNPEGRQMNRRTEIKVVGKTDVVVKKKDATLDDAMKDADN
ncbi:MAG: OmpA family protein [Flavobacteriales bacterium]|nr:OmpA family protein [Flavobacteriales bacterium]